VRVVGSDTVSCTRGVDVEAGGKIASVTSPAPGPWSVIVPVKETNRGKSRLATARADDRRELALAFALDTVAVAVASEAVRRVVVVTNDPAADAFVRLGADVISDQPDAGLNPAFVHGAHHVAALDPSSGLIGLAGDLPALTTEVLDMALSAAPPGRWFVGDVTGTGTTMLGVRGERLAPAFGPHSRARHRAGGAVELELAGLARLRRDVDTEVDLWDAVRLGVGVHTREVLSRHQLRQLA
jgi:2-phospho-L-lactate/phosphoenolpyruvate guanylyltransferase